MTVLFTDGFESGDTTSWTGTGSAGSSYSLSVETYNPHHEVYNCKASVGDGASSVIVYKTVSETGTAYIRGYFKWSANPTTNTEQQLLVLRGSAGTNVARFQIANISDVIYVQSKYRKNGATATINATYSFAINVWYCLELYTKISSTVGAIGLYVNNVLVVSDSNFDNDDYGNIARGHVGNENFSAGYIHDVFIDCVEIADAYIGPLNQRFALINQMGY